MANQTVNNVGRVIANPVLGDTITFLKTAAETNGQYLLLKVELAPGGGVIRHYHTAFTEQFDVTEGTLHVELNGKHITLGPGETALIPRYAVHRFANAAAAPVVFMTQVRPACQFEKNLRISYGLARDGKTNRNGLPRNPLHLAVMFQYAGTYLPGFPAALQAIPFAPLAVIARLLGVERRLAARYLSHGS
jgi:quercetin dioxygenase-like cupin family protein